MTRIIDCPRTHGGYSARTFLGGGNSLFSPSHGGYSFRHADTLKED